MSHAMYEIRVAGVVSEQDLEDLGAVALAPGQVHTVLYGIPDEAALYGLLARLRDQGIEVTEVRRMPELAPDQDAADDGHDTDEEADGAT